MHFAVMLIVLRWSVNDAASPFKVQSSPGENGVEFATRATVASLLPLYLRECSLYHSLPILIFHAGFSTKRLHATPALGGLGLNSTELLELLESQLILAGMIIFDRLNLKPCNRASFSHSSVYIKERCRKDPSFIFVFINRCNKAVETVIVNE